MSVEIDTVRCIQLRCDLRRRQVQCSYDELRVLDQLLARLELGRSRYGHLDLSQDGRDWKREEAEEHLDAAVYRACDLLAKEKPDADR